MSEGEHRGRTSVARRDPVLARVVEGRGTVRFRDLEHALRRLGFSLARLSGSHRIYRHPKVPRPLSIQPKGNEAKRYQVNQLRDMIAEFNLLDE